MIGEDFDKVGSGLVSSRLERVFVELFDAVADRMVYLRSGESAVDAGSSFRRVATEEVCLFVSGQASAKVRKGTYCSCRGGGRCHR